MQTVDLITTRKVDEYIVQWQVPQRTAIYKSRMTLERWMDAECDIRRALQLNCSAELRLALIDTLLAWWTGRGAEFEYVTPYPHDEHVP